MDEHEIRRRLVAWAGPFLTLMLLCQAAAAADPAPGTSQGKAPGVMELRAETAQATVQAVDRAARTVTLRTEDGEEILVQVPDEVRNFDQVEVGDKLKVEYHEATAIFLRKAGEGAPSAASGASTGEGAPASDDRRGVSETSSVRLAPLGAKPGGLETRTVDITAVVEDVDYEGRKLTVRGPRGNVRTLAVGDDVENLEEVEKGDQIVVRHTKALAITVTK
jgi:hypothetical protein